MLGRIVVVWIALASASSAVADPAPHPPTDPRGATWIEAGVLALGGGGLDEEDVRWLHREGFRAVANVRDDHEDPRALLEDLGMTHLHVPIEHPMHINLTHVDEFLAWAAEQEAAGRPMYVHCENGWHRAATFVAAWLIVNQGMTFDEAEAHLAKVRPGTAMRASGVLLALEARESGEPALTVLLTSPTSRPEWNGSVEATVEVLLPDGRPAQGARVEFRNEGGSFRVEGVTGADGRFETRFEPPRGVRWIDFLYARASLDGHVDGGANHQVYYDEPVDGDALAVAATRDGNSVAVEVTDEEGAQGAHVLVLGADGHFAHTYTSTGRTVLPAPEGGEIVVRAEAWGGKGARATLPAPPPLEDAAEHRSDAWPTTETAPPVPAGRLGDPAPEATVAPPPVEAPPAASERGALLPRAVGAFAFGAFAVWVATSFRSRPGRLRNA